ncbi:MAG: UDP-3-O-(3-hydroxymyristoyl)glucosamine N-acyltransferase [Alphaproteobacteria bacterium]
MEHPGFFHRAGPFSLERLVQETGATLEDATAGVRQIHDIRPLNKAGQGDVCFLDNPKYAYQLDETQAGACFVQPKFAARVPDNTAALVTPEPYRAYASVLMLFYPEAGTPKTAWDASTATSTASASGGAHIHPSAHLEDGVVVEPGAVIGEEARIGEGSRIAAGAVIGYRCTIGRDCFIGPRAVVTHALIGNNVISHAGVAIGQDGFGFAMGRQGHAKVAQIGRVIIQDQVEIGANSTIDRGALRDTVIGEGTKIDNLVQIAHNVVVGRHCVLVSQVGISGSSELEDFVVMGGKSGLIGHITVGAGSQIAGYSGVSESIPPGSRWGGIPAKPLRTWAREIAMLKRLTQKLSGKQLKDIAKLDEK